MKSVALKYFKAFADKDLDALRQLLSDQVSLRDWEIQAAGLEAVLAECIKIFNVTSAISVTPVNLFVDGRTLIGELDIAIGDDPPTKVVDILEFDVENRICAIRAFKG